MFPSFQLTVASFPVPHPITPFPSTFQYALRSSLAGLFNHISVNSPFQSALISATLRIGGMNITPTSEHLLFFCASSRKFCAIFPRPMSVRRASPPATSLPSIPSHQPLFIAIYSSSRACMTLNPCTPHLSRSCTAVPVPSLSFPLRCACTFLPLLL